LRFDSTGIYTLLANGLMRQSKRVENDQRDRKLCGKGERLDQAVVASVLAAACEGRPSFSIIKITLNTKQLNLSISKL
jgi:hypothetical protein